MLSSYFSLPSLLERKHDTSHDGNNGHNGNNGKNGNNGNSSATGLVQNIALVHTLRSNRLLHSLGDDEMSLLLKASWCPTFKRDQVITQQAQPVDVVFFIVEGKAKAEVCAPGNGTCKAVVNILGPGEDIGLLSMVNSAPHSATVTAMEELRAVATPLATMRTYLHTRPEWYRALAEIATERLWTNGIWLQALL